MKTLGIGRLLAPAAILLLWSSTAHADGAAITGYVSRGADKAPVPGVAVSIKENGANVLTDAKGAFAIRDLPPGIYTVIVNDVGAPLERRVELGASGSVAANFALDAATGTAVLDRIVVNGQRSTEEDAREAQQYAPNLINLTTADEIRKLPDVNAAEALRRMPGISLETDTGEGRYINIRGIDSDLNSTTFGGLRLPPSNNASPSGGGRAVAMDAIPTGLIGALTVTKTNTPEQDAEALGGTIEITPKTAPLGSRGFVDGHAGSGFEQLRGTAIADTSVTAGTRFGGGDIAPGSMATYADRPFSIVGTVSYYADQRGINDFEPGYIDSPGVPNLGYSALDQRYYQYNRKRHGYGLDLGYQPDARNSWYVRGFDAGYVEAKRDDHLVWNFAGSPTPDPSSPNSLIDTVSSLQQTVAFEKERIDNKVFVAGGKNAIGDVVLDYRIGHTTGSYNVGYSYGADFQYAPANGLVSYDNVSNTSLPRVHPLNFNPYDPSQYTLDTGGLSNSTTAIADRENSFGVNLRIPQHFTDDEDENIKVGASGRLRQRTASQQQWSYNVPAGLASLPLTADTLSGTYGFYNGSFTNVGKINVPLLLSLVGGQNQYVAVTDSIANQQAYNAEQENVYAAYGQYAFGWKALTVLAGLRVESTHATYNALQGNNVYDAGNNLVGYDARDVAQPHSYNNVFPSAQARYEFSPTLIGRAAISSAIARPGFEQITAAVVVDPVNVAVTRGNPALKPTTGVNYDFSLEKYLPNGGIASVSLFDKEFSNYIGGTTINTVFTAGSGPYPILNGVGTINSFINLPHAYARGIELNYEQRYKKLPGWLGGFGAGANYTFVDSSFQIRPGESSLLPSTSKNTANLSLMYERDGLDLRLGAYFVSRDLFSIGSSSATDVWSRNVFQLDWGSSYQYDKHWGVYFNAKNLTNYVLKFTEGTGDKPIQREYYGQTYTAGVSFSFN